MQITKQLDLVFDVPVVNPPKTWQNWRTTEQELETQRVLGEIREETAKIMRIAKSLYPDNFSQWQTLRDMPTEILTKVCGEFYKQNPPLNAVRTERIPVKPKPWKPWSIERKHRARIFRLEARLRKKWTIPEMFIQQYLEACAKDPQAFGLCLLPTASDRCPVKFDSPQKIAALKLEFELRAAEAKKYQEYQEYLATTQPNQSIKPHDTIKAGAAVPLGKLTSHTDPPSPEIS